MFRIGLLLISILFLLPLPLLANGGGIYAISATMRSSDPRFRSIKDITLLSEKLYIKINADRADVTVKYILVNNSNKDYIGVDYAFPIDYITINSYDDWSNSSLRNLSFQLNNKILPYEYSEEKVEGEESIIEYTHTDYTKKYVRRWFYTKLDIPKNSSVSLDVNYSVETLALADGDNPTEVWYLTSPFSHNFRYDFSPAQYWGDGMIRDFYVQVDNSALDLSGDLNKENLDYSDVIPNNFRIEGLPFEKSGKVYEYRTRNFQLKDAKPISITYLTPQFSSTDIINRYLIPSNMYTVSVSSENQKYPSSNLSDLNLETTWVPNKSIGESIEFTFKKPTDDFAGIVILNGFLKNEKTFYENNRIKVITVEVKQVGKDWIAVGYPSDEPLFLLEDKKYQTVYFENLFNLDLSDVLNFYDSQLDPDIAIEKIRINIKDIYPGTKYDDTCISEIMFLKK